MQIRKIFAAAFIGAVGAVVTLGFTVATASAEPPDGKGTNTTETRSTSTPANPNGFGSVTSQRAVDDHDIGTHASSFAPGQDPSAVPAQRLGVGNVAANDGALFDLTGLPDTGTRPGDHAAPIGDLTGYPATNRPGTRVED